MHLVIFTYIYSTHIFLFFSRIFVLHFPIGDWLVQTEKHLGNLCLQLICFFSPFHFCCLTFLLFFFFFVFPSNVCLSSLHSHHCLFYFFIFPLHFCIFLCFSPPVCSSILFSFFYLSLFIPLFSLRVPVSSCMSSLPSVPVLILPCPSFPFFWPVCLSFSRQSVNPSPGHLRWIPLSEKKH